MARRSERGVTTLVVVLSLLVILTLVILGASNVALLEQKTATTENRQKVADQAAEYGVNLAGEFLKVNLTKVSSKKSGGWLVTGATPNTLHWLSCNGLTTFPCSSERDTTRRNNMYYYSYNGSTSIDYGSIAGAMTSNGGAGGTTFPVTTTVAALLCRVDTTLTKVVGAATVVAPDCRLSPSVLSASRVAVTFISDASLDGENTAARIKETWASYSASVGISAVPLVASGSVEGLGNANIVPAPNGAGYGVPVSIWSPCPVDIEQSPPTTYPTGCTAPSGSGVGSVSTCQLGDFLKNTPEADLLTTCASGTSCGCGSASGSDFLSGHTALTKKEGVDILDVDGNHGTNLQGESTGCGPSNAQGCIPDITFFPGREMDNNTDPLDDSLFEYVFGQEAVAETTSLPVNAVSMTCGSGSQNCAVYALTDILGATTVADCSSLSSASSGLYYVTGTCNLPSQIGSPTSQVIVVVNGDAGDVTVNGNSVLYGMLFIRSNTNAANFRGTGNVTVFGSVAVEGKVNITGGLNIVYYEIKSEKPDDGLIPTTRFARLPGSWLDSASGF